MYTRQKTCTINKTERYLYLSGLVNSRGGPLSGLVNLLHPIRDASQFRLALILTCWTKQKQKKKTDKQINKHSRHNIVYIRAFLLNMVVLTLWKEN